MPTLAKNKRARFEYEILETFEAGLLLTGPEVKSIRAGQCSLSGSFVTFHGAIPHLTNAHIAPYAFAVKNEQYNPTQSRRLLLKKNEIAYLRGKLQEKGLTAVPLSLYTKDRYIKLEVGLARGKKTHDKRATIKKREVDREIRRALS
jgi:SsrA-binding protein